MVKSSQKQSILGGFGCLLLVFAFGYLVVGVIFRPIMPDFVHGVLDGVFDTTLCGPDEQYEQDPFLRGAMRRNIVGEGDSYCLNPQGEQRDISFEEFNLAVALFVIPACVGAVLAGRSIGAVPTRPAKGVPLIPASRDLSGRLRELQDAYDQGLITREEYDSTRQKLLDGMEQ